MDKEIMVVALLDIIWKHVVALPNWLCQHILEVASTAEGNIVIAPEWTSMVVGEGEFFCNGLGEWEMRMAHRAYKELRRMAREELKEIGGSTVDLMKKAIAEDKSGEWASLDKAMVSR